MDKYRFLQGSLYIYNEDQNAYVHCFKRVGVNTKAKAIEAYEEELMMEEDQDMLEGLGY